MGKRIPKTRRHKKLKFVDPCYSGERLKTKNRKLLPNEPPVNSDYQDVPHRMNEVINVKNQIKAGKFKKKRKRKKIMKDDFIVVKNNILDGDTHGAKRPIKSLPSEIKQNEFETEEKFLTRISRMANNAIAEAKIEEKYNIELVNVDKKGNAEYKPASKEISDKKKEKRKKNSEKEKEKKKMKLEDTGFDLKREKIDLNDVVLAPPTFTAKPRKAPATNKPGKKQLHLKSILESNKAEDKNNNKPPSKKLKDLPLEKRQILEHERIRAVQMYRILKNKKSNK